MVRFVVDWVRLRWLGVPPGGRAYFLLLRQKKVAKEKATPRSAPGVARSLALLVRPGGLPELACGSDMANRNPPARLRCSAPSTGTRKASTLNHVARSNGCYGQPPKQTQNKTATTSSTPALPLPLKKGRSGGGWFFKLGVPPCGWAYFLLLRQKKVAKEKATPGYVVGCANSPALLEAPGGCGTRGFAPQTVLAESPRPFSVARRSTRGPKNVTAEPNEALFHCHGQQRKTSKIAFPKLATDALPGPLRGAEQRRNAGGLRFAMFEPQASSGKPPGVSSSARNRRSRRRPRGRLFFAHFLLAKQKKVRRPPGGTPAQLVEPHP